MDDLNFNDNSIQEKNASFNEKWAESLSCDEFKELVIKHIDELFNE